MVIDTLGGGRIEPRELAEEMRSSYLDYAMSVIVGRALPDVRDGLKPVHRRVLFSMPRAACSPDRPYSKCARVVGDVLGKYHPHGDTARLRRAGAHGAVVLAALPAGRRPGQLRHQRRLRRRRHALHRVPAAASWPSRCCATSTPTPSTSCRTTTGASSEPTVLPAGSRTCSSTARPGSPSAWRPTSRRTTWARSIDAGVALIDNPDATLDDLMRHIKGPDFPTGGDHHGHRRHPRRLRDRPRPGRDARPRCTPRSMKGGRNALIVTELPVHGQEGGDDGVITKIAELVQRQGDHRDLRHQRRLGPHRHARRHRAQARRDPDGRAEQALQAHRAADDLRRQHGGAGRRRPAHALAAADARRTTSTTRRRWSPAAPSSSSTGPSAGRTCSRAT